MSEAADTTPLPPATFDFFVLSLKYQAEVAMGLYWHGEEEDRPEPDPRIARHTIDMLAMLQDKTRGNLSMDEQRLLENSITELRFRYVQATQAANKPVEDDPDDKPGVTLA